MKLDFESNISTFTPVENDSMNRVESESNSIDVSKMLRAGIEAAQNGRPAEARALLLHVTEADPNNEKAWLWLASISEYPEELLIFLNSVLKINPENARALEWAKATKSLLSKTFVQRGIDASKEQSDFARQCFLQAVAHDNQNEMAWLWLASVSPSDEEKSAHLQKVLDINPDNQTAKSLFESINRKKDEMMFQKAVSFAADGDNASALDALAEFTAERGETEETLLFKSFLVQSFCEKQDCFARVLEMNAENNLARMNADFLHSMTERGEVKGVESQKAEANDFATDAAEQAHAEDDFQTESEEVFMAEENNEAESVQEESLEFSEPQAKEAQAEEVPFEEAATVEFKQEEAQPQTEFSDEPQIEENGYAFYQKPESTDYFSQTQVSYDENETQSDVYTDSQSPPQAFEMGEEPAEDYSFQMNSYESQPLNEETEFNEISEDSDNEPVSMESYSQEAKNETAQSDSADVYEIDEVETVAENNYSHLFQEAEEADESDSEPFSDTALPFDENASSAVEQSVHVSDAPSYYDEENSPASPAESVECLFCNAVNEQQTLVCRSCRGVLTFSDLEMVLANQEADKEMIGNAVCQMEAWREQYDLSSDELKQLALGYLNIGDLPKGLGCLTEATRMNPDDIVLSSQVNALKIRLTEIEKQKDLHSSMPKNLTILVVDDSATVRKLISGKLEKSGHEVVCAMDGIEALEKMKDMIPDLILLDINMPRMDGYQVCKMIRSNESTKDVPVVMISGKDGFFDKVRGRMAGTTGYITKPFGPETLMKTVETYIN